MLMWKKFKLCSNATTNLQWPRLICRLRVDPEVLEQRELQWGCQEASGEQIVRVQRQEVAESVVQSAQTRTKVSGNGAALSARRLPVQISDHGGHDDDVLLAQGGGHVRAQPSTARSHELLGDEGKDVGRKTDVAVRLTSFGDYASGGHTT
jgi:predicted flavoprotein YhiN